MKLLVAGLLLVALECCHCKPFETGFDFRADAGLSAGFKDGTFRFGPDVGVKGNAYFNPTSGQTQEKSTPISSPPVSLPYPSDPYGYYQQPPFAYPPPSYGANQQSFYGYQPPMYPVGYPAGNQAPMNQ